MYRVVREMLPREQFGPDQLLLWLEDTQLRNERARRSQETPLHPPRKQDGAATLNPCCSTRSRPETPILPKPSFS